LSIYIEKRECLTMSDFQDHMQISDNKLWGLK
jgi:hypothetical protein